LLLTTGPWKRKREEFSRRAFRRAVSHSARRILLSPVVVVQDGEFTAVAFLSGRHDPVLHHAIARTDRFWTFFPLQQFN